MTEQMKFRVIYIDHNGNPKYECFTNCVAASNAVIQLKKAGNTNVKITRNQEEPHE